MRIASNMHNRAIIALQTSERNTETVCREIKMKKWCYIDNCGTDEYIFTCESKEEALKQADFYWNSLTDSEKKHRESFVVALCNLEEYAPGQWGCAGLGSGEIDCELYAVAKEYC